jgi:hypothetical protein
MEMKLSKTINFVLNRETVDFLAHSYKHRPKKENTENKATTLS